MSRLILLILFTLPVYCSFGQKDLQAAYDSARVSGNLDLAKEVNLELKTANRPELLAHSYYLIAYLQKREESYYDAVSNYFEALSIYRDLEDKSQSANVIENIANIYHITGFHKTALQYYYDAVAMKTALHDERGVTKLNSHIGLQFSKLKRYEEALHYYNNAAAVAAQNKQDALLHWIYNHLGLLHGETENYLEAAQSYTQALNYAGTSDEKAGVYNNIGYMRLLMQDTSSALKNFSLARELISSKDGVHSIYTGSIYSNIASIYEAENADSALFFYKQSYNFLKEHPLRMSERYFKICKKLKTLSQDQGNLKLALAYSEDIDKLAKKLLELRIQLNDLYNRYQVEAATYRFQHQEKAKALERQLVIDRYIKMALTGVIVIMIFLTITLYRKNRKIRFAQDTARKIYQVINS